ncbi:MAG: Imm26 family immunity protein [Desulfobulbaceae bacterium]|nr:Imm26 family immunity protein [Desulfobulbaceae bacterium]
MSNDVFEIPLSSGKRAYGQYVFMDKYGPMVQVFDLITEERTPIDALRNAKPLFPPVITGLHAAIRAGLWEKIGKLPVENFSHPKFVTTLFNAKTGKAGIWSLYDGVESKRIGSTLPDELKELEFLMVWSPYDVVHRIETGEYPFPFRELIIHNMYTPRSK